MAGKNKIKRLPPEIVAEINAMLDRDLTLDEILAHLRNLKVDVSRSGLGRYSQEFKVTRDNLKRALEMGTALGRELGSADDENLNNVVVQLAQAVAFNVMRGQAAEDAEVSAKDFVALMKGVHHAASARKVSVDAAEKLHKAWAARLETEKKAAAEQVSKTAAERGLSADTVAAIKQSILGINVPAAAKAA